MLTLVGAGMILFMALVLLILWRWGAMPLQGKIPVSTLVFVAILFTSGLDVGLIMFPLTEFPVYENLKENSEYAFANPLAIEFGFWGFMVWAIYFVTCFYFCALEPKLRFFEITWVKWVNNIVIIGTCAFTAHLLFANLSWYLPTLAPEAGFPWLFAGLVTLTICAAVYSSTELRFVKVLSVSSGALFLGLIVTLGSYVVGQPNVDAADYLQTLPLLSDYFTHLQRFILPINDYHAFYLFWWFAWSIMIGQFTARFVGNMKTVTLLVNMLVWPSLSLGLWFSVLYLFHTKGVDTSGWINRVMVGVGVVFVLNSLDSLIRLYSDNLNLTVSRLGKPRYFALHAFLMTSLTVFFSLEFIRIQWVGALVIGIGVCCVIYALAFKDKRAQLPAADRLF
ncbi:BCCT family transporter [Idiomarina sp.]|uniref:BCCT family transporter n=1 Tax=Idiomarina sp. TaxID=1874361 RepID=UPI001D3CA226|nr:BCCT family transporter [Idiomarina sp.]MCJ8317712.1 BCCT family transporter [Idiomarina sp.]NQZ17272.1 BCCT family transporter [Idiomarina sp.]